MTCSSHDHASGSDLIETGIDFGQFVPDRGKAVIGALGDAGGIGFVAVNRLGERANLAGKLAELADLVLKGGDSVVDAFDFGDVPAHAVQSDERDNGNNKRDGAYDDSGHRQEVRVRFTG